jgi:hypothetical protein
MINNTESFDVSSSIISIPSPLRSTNQATPKKHDVTKTARDEFFTNITKNEKNWSAQCLLCNETILDNIGVTSNVNRHIKNRHKTEYAEWLNKLNKLAQQQPKLVDFTSKKSPLRSSSKQLYPVGHPREKELHDAIIQNLIIDLGLPLSLVERPEYMKFMYTVDPKFKITSRRTLNRKTIPTLYNIMNDSLKQFCATAEYISLTLDIWTDRRTRPFFCITGTWSIFF